MCYKYLNFLYVLNLCKAVARTLEKLRLFVPPQRSPQHNFVSQPEVSKWCLKAFSTLPGRKEWWINADAMIYYYFVALKLVETLLCLKILKSHFKLSTF